MTLDLSTPEASPVFDLVSFGIRRKRAWDSVYQGRKSIWAMSHMSTVDRALPNSHWDARGLMSIENLWRTKHEQVVVPAQLLLALG